MCAHTHTQQGVWSNDSGGELKESDQSEDGSEEEAMETETQQGELT